MNVADLFKRLSYGELSNLSISGEGSGTIIESKRASIISHLNEGLLRLYSRFVLRENDLILMTSEWITHYYFQSKHAWASDPIEGVIRYIMDTPEKPFEDDLIKVLQVLGSDGKELALNDPDNPQSVYTPQPNSLQVPLPIQDDTLNIVYQARHAPVPDDDLTALIEIPIVLEGALVSFIAHRVFSGMNGQENAAKAMEHLTLFEAICAETVDRDLVNSSQSQTGHKFNDRGFV